MSKGMHEGWACTPEDATVAVSVILSSQVAEGDAVRYYIVASAKPASDPEGEYNCHACAPAIGAAVFVWKNQRWTLESENTATEFAGGWGDPPSVELVAVGSEKHGLILSYGDEGQGFSSSFSEIIIPLGKNVEKVWSIESGSDDNGAIDPDDKLNSPPPYSSSTTFRFLKAANGTERLSDYYDIEVTSSGTSWQGPKHPVKAENWTELYRFSGGKYRLMRKTVLTGAKNPEKGTHR